MLLLTDPSASVLLIGGICALATLLVGMAFYRMYLDARKTRENIAKGIPATATVLHVGSSDASSDGIDVNLTLEVMPPGGAPYKLHTTWSVEPVSVSKIQPGCTVAIKIDAHDPKKVYSAEDWAWAMGQMPPSFKD